MNYVINFKTAMILKNYFLFYFAIFAFISCDTNKKNKLEFVECPSSYIDTVFRINAFYDTIRPNFGMEVSISNKCTNVNGYFYKHLLIRDSLYKNDTVLSEYIRASGHSIYAYNFSLKEEYCLVDLQSDNFFNPKISYSPLKYVSPSKEKNDSLINYTWIGYLGISRYYFQFSKKNGLENIYRTYDGPFLEL